MRPCMALKACATWRTSSGPVSPTRTSGPRPMASAAAARRRKGEFRLRSSKTATRITPPAISVVESSIASGTGAASGSSSALTFSQDPSRSRGGHRAGGRGEPAGDLAREHGIRGGRGLPVVEGEAAKVEQDDGGEQHHRRAPAQAPRPGQAGRAHHFRLTSAANT